MNYYNNIKELIINNEITKKVKTNSINKSDIDTYYRIGKELKEAGKHYGESIIKEYSNRLTSDLGIKYSSSNLWRYIQFYDLIQKVATVWRVFDNHVLTDMYQHISWSHIKHLLPMDNTNEVIYYINKVINNNLSVRQLRNIIKSNEYNRLPRETKEKIINNQSLYIMDNIKDPILIKSSLNKDKISEKYLHDTIVENISSFMKQLGDGYSFIDSEYPIRIGNKYNYIDILLFNIKYNCYVVVELKVTTLKKDHIGQIQIYMNYIDQNVKSFRHDKTIGLIISKKNNEFIIKYSSDKRIKAVEWVII